MPAHDSQLVRGLTLTSATALVIGSIIGTGVFFKAAIMSQQVGSPALVLAAWLVAGLLSLAGALTYAELGAMLPHAGGEYLYVRTAYGDAAGFLNGWMRFVVGSAGIAALGVGFATFLSAVAPMPAVWAQRTFHLLGRDIHWQLGVREAVAVAAILLFGVINCAGVAFGGRLQSVLTAAKALGIAIIVVGAFLFSDSGSPAHFRTPASAPQWTGLQAFGAAMRFGVVGLRWMGLHADGGGRGEGPRPQYSASVDHRRSGRAGALRTGQPGVLLGAAVRRDSHREFELCIAMRSRWRPKRRRHSWDRAARRSSRSCS